MSIQALLLLMATASALVVVASAVAGLVISVRLHPLHDARERLDKAIAALRGFEDQPERGHGCDAEVGEALLSGGAVAAAREAHLASAIDALRHRRLGLSYVDCMVLAAALSASGRRGEALKFYGRGCDRVDGHFGRAVAQRAFGAALMGAGEFAHGRRRLLTASAAFLDLSRNPAFDHDTLLAQAFETQRLLVKLELDHHVIGNAGADLRQLCQLACALRDPARAAAARRALADLTTSVERLRHGPGLRHVAAADEAGGPPRTARPDLVLVSG